MPNDHTSEAGSGLSGRTEPSGLIRRMLPPSDDRSCASSRLPALPVLTYSLPPGPNAIPLGASGLVAIASGPALIG
jgi:hypothetical protein